MRMVPVRLNGVETSENPNPSWSHWRYVRRTQRNQATAVAAVFGALALASSLVAVLERMFNIAFAMLGLGLGLLVVGWLIFQVIAEIKLRRCYDTRVQRAVALRKGAEALRARQVIAAREAAAALQEADRRQAQLLSVIGPASVTAPAVGPGALPPAGGGNPAHRTTLRGHRTGSRGGPRRLPRC
jgi:hypothetical protein